MTTTHPYISKADALLERAAELVHEKWQRRDEGHKPYGIPEALAEAGAGVELVIAERQCVSYGLDVWWNDLLCLDGDDAAEELLKLTGIDGAALYGPMWEANVGLLVLSSQCHAATLNGLANMLTVQARASFDECVELARATDRGKLLDNLCEDIHYSVGHEATTPAGVARRLFGIRALECVAAHHVLYDLLPMSTKRVLVDAVSQLLLPVQVDL